MELSQTPPKGGNKPKQIPASGWMEPVQGGACVSGPREVREEGKGFWKAAVRSVVSMIVKNILVGP